jgi:hypothetical protein
MKIRYTMIATLAAAAAGCTNPADIEAPNSTFVPPVMACGLGVSIGIPLHQRFGWKAASVAR